MGYIIFTSIVGFMILCVGCIVMGTNWEFGASYRDVRIGAVLILIGITAPISIPLATIVLIAVGTRNLSRAMRLWYKEYLEDRRRSDH